MTCEDFPCCGHDICPDFDSETGKQLNMRCTCGAVVPLHSRSSLCASCLRGSSYDDDGGYDEDDGGDVEDDEDDDYEADDVGYDDYDTGYDEEW